MSDELSQDNGRPGSKAVQERVEPDRPIIPEDSSANLDTPFRTRPFAARLPERGRGKWAPGPETEGFVPAPPELEYRIRALLEESGEIDASGIDVWVADGEILLRGNVRTDHESRLAGQKLQVAFHETGIHNALQVGGENKSETE